MRKLIADSSPYSYGAVEAALAALHQIDEERIGAFRARLKHLKNLGIPMVQKVGSGSRVQYSRDHVWQVAVALELEACGIGPNEAAAWIKKTWRKRLRDQCHVAAFQKTYSGKPIETVAWHRQVPKREETESHKTWCLVFSPDLISKRSDLGLDHAQLCQIAELDRALHRLGDRVMRMTVVDLTSPLDFLRNLDIGDFT